MKIRSLSKLTRTYALALSLIALLTLATFITMHQVILTQKDSALLLILMVTYKVMNVLKK